MNESIFILQGDIIYTTEVQSKFEICENGYLVCEQRKGKRGISARFHLHYGGIPVKDYEGKLLIIPGLVDLHIHAPQYSFRGLGMDMELLEWLECRIHFRKKLNIRELDYARRRHTSIFTENCKRRSATTRACIFATVHREATLLLMDLLEEAGSWYDGRQSQHGQELSGLPTGRALQKSLLLKQWNGYRDVEHKKYKYTSPILTPRFIPSCTDELMENLKKIQIKVRVCQYSLICQKISGEIAWVKELCPHGRNSMVTLTIRFGLFGADCADE